jgi:peptidoglycan/LPS O-acetylase OafA/YrhL
VIAAHTGIAASLFAANIYLYHLGTGYFAIKSGLDPLLHTWTLAVEEQFYLVFPLLLLVVWRLARRRPRLVAIVVVGAGCIPSFGTAVVLAGGPETFDSHQRVAFYGSPTRAWEFGAGALLALIAPQLPRVSQFVRATLGFGGFAAILAGAFLIKGTTSFPGWWALLPVGGTCGLLASGSPTSSLSATRLLSVRPLVWLGNLSYSWYLWHWPAIVFAKALFPHSPVSGAAAALSLLPAWLSYRYVENPIRFNPRFKSRRTLALATICIAVPIASSAGLLAMHGALERTAALRQWGQVTVSHADIARGCESTVPIGRRSAPQWRSCTWKVPHPRGLVVLVGDSNAGQFTEPVTRAGTAAGYDVTVAPLAGCPFVAIRIVNSSVSEADCRRFDSESLAALLHLHPSLVILANRDDLLISTSSKGFGSVAGGQVAFDAPRKARLWEQGLAAVLQPLSRAGIPVLLVRPVPAMPSLPSGCAVLRVLVHACAGSVTRRKVAATRRVAIAAENQAAGSGSTIVFADFENDFCGATTCSSVRHATILYRDLDHLTVAGALTLTHAFYREITAHARYATSAAQFP